MASAFSHAVAAAAIGASKPPWTRGISHSLRFAVVPAVLVVALGFRRTPEGVKRLRLCFYFFLATASHSVLDALTNSGPGIAFVAPIDNSRYFLPIRPVVVFPLGHSPPSSRNGPPRH